MDATKKKQKATLAEGNIERARNHDGDKERTGTLSVIAFDRKASDRFACPVEARFWMGRSKSSSTVYCSVWIRPRDGGRWLSGTGSAGGYGYHKDSAAFDEALRSAGVKLVHSIHGVGDGAMREAALAVAHAAGYARLPLTVLT